VGAPVAIILAIILSFGGWACCLFLLYINASAFTSTASVYAFLLWLLAICLLIPVALICVLICIAIGIYVVFGLFKGNANQAYTFLLCGKYVGTSTTRGFRWLIPCLFVKKKFSLKLRSFETGKLHVNDKSGNPIIIAAVVVWKVKDTAMAAYDVEDYVRFVHLHSEVALRELANAYSYDAPDSEISLRADRSQISEFLFAKIQERIYPAGGEIVEARINHLAYSQEVANAMLQLQQASSVVAARRTVAEGAVIMVENTLTKIKQASHVKLSSDQEADIAGKLLVVLCTDSGAQ